MWFHLVETRCRPSWNRWFHREKSCSATVTVLLFSIVQTNRSSGHSAHHVVHLYESVVFPWISSECWLHQMEQFCRITKPFKYKWISIANQTALTSVSSNIQSTVLVVQDESTTVKMNTSNVHITQMARNSNPKIQIASTFSRLCFWQRQETCDLLNEVGIALLFKNAF